MVNQWLTTVAGIGPVWWGNGPISLGFLGVGILRRGGLGVAVSGAGGGRQDWSMNGRCTVNLFLPVQGYNVHASLLGSWAVSPPRTGEVPRRGGGAGWGSARIVAEKHGPTRPIRLASLATACRAACPRQPTRRRSFRGGLSLFSAKKICESRRGKRQA